MNKSSALKQLDTIVGKLMKLNYNIEGSPLNEAIKEVAHVREKLFDTGFKMKKTKSR